MHTKLLNQSFKKKKSAKKCCCCLVLCRFVFCVFNLHSCWSETQAHTDSMCRLSISLIGRQTEGPAMLRGARCSHADTEVRCLSCRACLPGTSWLLGALSQCLLGKDPGGREVLTHTPKLKERPQMSCVVAWGKKSTSRSVLSGAERSLLFLGSSVKARRICLVSLEAKLNVRAAIDAADLTKLSIDKGRRRGQLFLNMYTAVFGIDIWMFVFHFYGCAFQCIRIFSPALFIASVKMENSPNLYRRRPVLLLKTIIFGCVYKGLIDYSI